MEGIFDVREYVFTARGFILYVWHLVANAQVGTSGTAICVAGGRVRRCVDVDGLCRMRWLWLASHGTAVEFGRYPIYNGGALVDDARKPLASMGYEECFSPICVAPLPADCGSWRVIPRMANASGT